MDQTPSTTVTGDGSTAAQLKHDINSGLTGDKVAGFDPAAAPLGTDEEAGGAPLTPGQLDQARRAERSKGPATPAPHAAEPQLQPDGLLPSRSLIVPVLIGIGAAAALALGLFAVL